MPFYKMKIKIKYKKHLLKLKNMLKKIILLVLFIIEIPFFPFVLVWAIIDDYRNKIKMKA